MMTQAPLILGIGGTLRAESSSERALRVALGAAERLGARVHAVTGSALDLPFYEPGMAISQDRRAATLVELYRHCSGLIVSSPGYHGSISGRIKNAIDYIEELRDDPRVYLDGLPVGCIATAGGWQSAGTTLNTLRSVAFALRGWPTPLGVMINSTQTDFDPDGNFTDPRIDARLNVMADQIMAFIRTR